MKQKINFNVEQLLDWCPTDAVDCLSLRDCLKVAAQVGLDINEDGDFDITVEDLIVGACPYNYVVTFTPAAEVIMPRKGSYSGSIVNGKIQQ